MTNPKKLSQNLEREQVVSELARWDDSDFRAKPANFDDLTLRELKAELDTLAAELRELPPVDEFMEEVDCLRALELVERIGHEPTILSQQAPLTAPYEEVDLSQIGPYQFVEKLGEGGMGAVYKALHIKLKRIVAIKVLPAERMKDAVSIARFEREMEAVGRLQHPNIVAAHDAGEVDGMHYLVMEYVDGLDLSALLRLNGPLGVAEACEISRQAAIGLQEAHEHNMVHRDIKPSNLMLARVGRGSQAPVVKILDMGLALLSAAHSPDAHGLTTTGQVMGTLDYMAPEQGGDSKNVDIRVDIYALGASLYKLLCGEAIFHGEKYHTPVQKLMALATQEAPPIQRRRAGIPQALAAVVHRMIRKNPDERMATPQEVANALAPFCVGADLTALMNKIGDDIAPATNASSSDTLENPGQVDISSIEITATQPRLVPVLKKPSATSASSAGRKLPPWAILAIGGGLLGVVGFLCGVIFFFPTPDGTLRVEINDPTIEVLVKGSDIVLKKAETEEITLSPGEHTLVIKRGDFTFETSNFVLKKGETTTVKVDILPGKVQVALADGAILSEHETATPLATAARSLPAPGASAAAALPSSTASYAERIESAKSLLLAGAAMTIRADDQLMELKSPEDVPKTELHVVEVSFSEERRYSAQLLPRIMAFPEVIKLTLIGPVTNRDLRTIGSLPQLEEVVFKDAEFTDDGLNNSPGFSMLRKLHLWDCSKLEGVLELKGFNHLQVLTAVNARVTDISRLGEFPDLMEMNLFCSGMTDAGLNFASVPRRLNRLYVEHCQLTDDGLKHLSAIKTLRVLRLDGTLVTLAGVTELQGALPECGVGFNDDGNWVELRPKSEAANPQPTP